MSTETYKQECREPRDLGCAVWALVEEVKQLNAWLETHTTAASKDDLAASEARIISALNTALTNPKLTERGEAALAMTKAAEAAALLADAKTVAETKELTALH